LNKFNDKGVNERRTITCVGRRIWTLDLLLDKKTIVSLEIFMIYPVISVFSK